MVVRSGDIVLPGIYLLLHYVYPNDIDTPRQDNNMIRICSSCAATYIYIYIYIYIYLFSLNKIENE